MTRVPTVGGIRLTLHPSLDVEPIKNGFKFLQGQDHLLNLIISSYDEAILKKVGENLILLFLIDLPEYKNRTIRWKVSNP